MGKHETLNAALAALARTLGSHTRLHLRAAETTQAADAFVEFDLDGTVRRYAVRVEDIQRREQLAAFKGVDGKTTPLLATNHLSRELAELSRKLGIQFIDTSGNAYLRAKNLYVFVAGQPRTQAARPPRTGGSGSTAALKMMLVLLSQPRAFLEASQREIARAADVALGSVGATLRDLETRGLIRIADARLLEPARLLDEFAINYPARLRPKLNPQRFAAPGADWWQDFDPLAFDAAWSGEVAGQALVPDFRAASQTLYVGRADPKNRPRLIVQNRLRPDPDGKVEILDAFWTLPQAPQQPGFVPPPLVYADLLASLEPRALEVAAEIRKRWIADEIAAA